MRSNRSGVVCLLIARSSCVAMRLTLRAPAIGSRRARPIMRAGYWRQQMKRIAMAIAAAFLTGGIAHAHGDAAAHGDATSHGDTAAHGGHGTAPAKKTQKPWGVAGDPKAVKRTVEIATRDEMRFSPSAIQVAQGETVRLVVRNDGKLMHELVIGTKKELDAHAATMA